MLIRLITNTQNEEDAKTSKINKQYVISVNAN